MASPKSRSDVLRTLAYADVFDYPLTLPEIHRWLISSETSLLIGTKANTSEVAEWIPRTVKTHRGYYFLKGRPHLVKLRQARSRFSQEKLQLAHRVGEWLKSIPTIKLVAVTGALAMRNSDPNDDIDLMIVTSPNTLWLTRILVVIFIEILGLRRRPTSRYALLRRSKLRLLANRFCLNLWLDETSLAVPKPKRNLYTAHEVAQVKPLWSRGRTYQQFLSANRWINHYLPNIKIKTRPLVASRYPLVAIFNRLAFRLQLWYMRPRLTRETVTLHAAFFHPRNTSRLVMRQYHRRLVKLGIKP